VKLAYNGNAKEKTTLLRAKQARRRLEV